jgi:hypothetical protein
MAHQIGFGYYRRLCSKHHKQRYGMDEVSLKNIRQKPCARCGWHASQCEPYREIYDTKATSARKQPSFLNVPTVTNWLVTHFLQKTQPRAPGLAGGVEWEGVINMRRLIRAIVYAKTEAEALPKAYRVFDSLCREGGPFDYYRTWVQQCSPVSGGSRWRDVCLVASSPAGKQLIKGGFQSTKTEFKINLEYIRKAVTTYTDEQLFEGVEKRGNLKGVFRQTCKQAGSDKAPAVLLYDEEGEGIKDSRQLYNVLRKWPGRYKNQSNPYEGMEVWVVLADAYC